MSKFKDCFRKFSWIEIIITICILNWAIINGYSALNPSIDVNSSAIFFGAYYKAFISGAFEFHRFFTSGFTHIGIIHLFVNMLAFKVIGLSCQRVFSTKKSIFILFSSIICGSYFLYCMNPNNTLAVGLSGGIYGLMGATIIYLWEVGALKIPHIRRQIISTVSINLLINFLPGIAAEAHLGGFIMGVFLGFLYSNNPTWSLAKNNAKISLVILLLLSPFLIKTKYEIPTDQIYLGTDIQVVQIADGFGLNFYSNWLENRMLSYYESLQ
ncbi:MAG: rhomboid family intramembrane serine protease [Anaerorhabdus sp.]